MIILACPIIWYEEQDILFDTVEPMMTLFRTDPDS